jgi:hypothetical protein
MMEKKHADLGLGGILFAAGLSLALGLPPPWWAEMPSYLIHMGLTTAVVLVLLGFIFMFVGYCEQQGEGWRRQFVLMWDSFLSRHWRFASLCVVLAIALAPIIVSTVENARLAGLRVGFHFDRPKSLDDAGVSLELLLSNDKGYVRLDEIKVVEVMTNSVPELPFRAFETCNSIQVAQQWDIDERMQSVVAPPIKVDISGLSISTHDLTDILINGEGRNYRAVAIQSGAPLAVQGRASLRPGEWGTFNTLVLCPVIHFYDSTLGASIMICPGVLMIHYSLKDVGYWRSAIPAYPPPAASGGWMSAEHIQSGLGELWAWKNGPFYLEQTGRRPQCKLGVP